MARTNIKSPMVFTHDNTTRGFGAGNTTITTTMVTPAIGARVARWGFTSTVIGEGNDTITASLIQVGTANTAANRLAAQLLLVPDSMTADTQVAGSGVSATSGVEGLSPVAASVEGERLNIDFANAGGADSFVTSSASYTVWALWAL